MTVQELIEMLQALPEEQKAFHVLMEGCDCVGHWSGAVNADEDSVTLERDDSLELDYISRTYRD